jgi:hypothetical protein
MYHKATSMQSLGQGDSLLLGHALLDLGVSGALGDQLLDDLGNILRRELDQLLLVGAGNGRQDRSLGVVSTASADATRLRPQHL